jgi:PAS domain S-box-containing protein
VPASGNSAPTNHEFVRSLHRMLQARDRTEALREAVAILRRSLRPESVAILRPVGKAHETVLASGPRARSQGKEARRMVVAIKSASRPIRLLTLRSRNGAPFGARDAQVVAAIAELISVVLRRFDHAQQLRTASRRWRRLLDTGSVVTFRASVLPTVRFDHVSDSVITLTGYTARELYANPQLVNRLLRPDDIKALTADLENPEQMRGRTRLLIIGKDGRRIWVSVVRNPIYDRRGRVVAVHGNACEIFEPVVSGEQLRAKAESTTALLRGQRLAIALGIIINRLRFVLDAEEAVVVAETQNRRSLRIICRDATDLNGQRGNRTISRRDPVFDRALKMDRSVMVNGSIATAIHWGGDLRGVLVVRGVRGDASQRAKAVGVVERFANEIAVAVESRQAHQAYIAQILQEDRSRIARELHDGVVQSLVGLEMILQMNAGTLPQPARNRVVQAAAGINEAILDIQQHIYDLEPTILAQGGLKRSLERLVAEFRASTRVSVSLDTEPGAIAALEGVSTHVVQIVREALSNVRRHSQARHARVTVGTAAGATVLEIHDDGPGFRPEATHGLGLRNLRNRAEMLGGKFEVLSDSRGGSRVRLTLPAPSRGLTRVARRLPDPGVSARAPRLARGRPSSGDEV